MKRESKRPQNFFIVFADESKGFALRGSYEPGRAGSGRSSRLAGLTGLAGRFGDALPQLDALPRRHAEQIGGAPE